MPELLHGTALWLHGQGLLLLGEPGSGKSTLAWDLMQDEGAMLVADDQVLLSAALEASAPASLAGLLEQRPFGAVRVPYRRSVRITLVAELTAAADNLRVLDAPVDWRGVPHWQLPRYTRAKRLVGCGLLTKLPYS
jgi:HPr kinase/phosphorylase